MKSFLILSIALLATYVVAEYATLPSDCNVFCAHNAVLNKSIGSGSVEKTAYFFAEGQFAPSVFETQDGQCTLQAAFQAHELTITGTVYDPSNPSTGFFIHIQSKQVKSDESHLELAESAYVTNGGWINPDSWLYYNLSSGSLTGFGIYQGVNLDLTQFMHPLQVGEGANGKNGNLGLSAWFNVTYNGHTFMTDINIDIACPPPAPTNAPTSAPPTVAPTVAPPVAPPVPVPSNAPTSAPPTDAPTVAPPTETPTTAATTSSTGSYTCPPNPFVAEQAIADQYGGNSYFAFIFNTSTNVQYRFDFVSGVGSFQVNDDGSALFSGNLSPISTNPSDGLFDFDFSAVVDFMPGTVPAKFHKELTEDAYVPNGPVDPTTWMFYAFSAATITPSNSAYSLTIAPYMDMDFQVGAGANGKNANYGASAWFSFYLVDNSNNNLLATGVMDINVDLICEAPSASDSAATTGVGSGSGSGSQSDSVGISGGVVSPSTTSASPATTSSSATTITASMLALFFVFALYL